MTATLETPAALAQFDRMRADQERFDATRPPCPSSWCDGTCEEEGHFGDAVLHFSPEVVVPTTPDGINEDPGSVRVRVWRSDGLNEPSESGVELDLSAAKWLFPDCANFSADQARQLVAALTGAINSIDPVPSGVLAIPALAVRVGDSILTEDGWQIVVGQMAFAESEDSYAQVNVWTDDYDHDPESDGWKFEPAEMVKVRRPLNTSGPVLNRAGDAR